MKEYVKIVQIKKLKMKLELYVLALVKKYEYRKSICKLRTSAHRLFIETGRYTNIPRNERICKNCTNQEIEDETHFLTRWKSGDLKLCWKISLPKHALITIIYLYYLLYVFITCLYVMFYQLSTLSLLWVYLCNLTICVISVCPSRAHNWNKIYLIWFDLYKKF